MLTNLLCFSIDDEVIRQQQIDIADTVRLMLHHQHPQWFDCLNYDDDRIFLEPSLLYYFSERSRCTLSIEQLLFGYLPKAFRPTHFNALTDPFGRVYLPDFGYILTDIRAEFVSINAVENSFNINNKEKTTWAPLIHSQQFLSGYPAVCQCLPFNLYLSTGKLGDVETPVSATLETYQPALLQAFDLLKNYVPDFWRLLMLVTRDVTVFESQTLRSMAAVSYQGTAFINTEGQPHDAVFFVEDLAHQCGHIMFNLIVWQINDFLALPKDTLLRSITNDPYDIRDIYGAFHGLFTYTTILHCLTTCVEAGAFSKTQTAETLARIGFFLRKLAIDVEKFRYLGIFTQTGQQFYDAFRAGFEQVHLRYQDTCQDFNYLTQPYIFNYTRFRTENSTNNIL